MKHVARALVGIAVGAVLTLAVTSAAVGHVSNHAVSGIWIPNFSSAALTASAGDNWIVQEGNLWGQRHSTLSIITPSNISGITEAWHVKLLESVTHPAALLPGEAPQLEYDGTLFAEDQYGGVYALNATTGQQIWQYTPHLPTYHIPPSDSTAAALVVTRARR